jgi:hypothetical protein
MGVCGHYSFGLGLGRVLCFCGHNEPSSIIKGGPFTESWSNYRFLKNEKAPWSDLAYLKNKLKVSVGGPYRGSGG